MTMWGTKQKRKLPVTSLMARASCLIKKLLWVRALAHCRVFHMALLPLAPRG